MFLSEFICKVGLPPSDLHRPPPPEASPILPSSMQPLLETSRRSELPSTSTTDTTHMSSTKHSPDTSRVPQVTRLPKQSLPTFSGNPLNWQTFWDSLDDPISQNTGFSGVQKFMYLHSQVQEDAACIIASFPLTDDNYAHSVTLLQA